MDHSYFIAAHIVARNADATHHALAEDAFYNTFGNDRLAGLKSALWKMHGFVQIAKIHLGPPAAAVTRKA